MKTIIFKLEIGDYAHCLWASGMKNFMHEKTHEGRFTLLEGNKKFKGKYLYFCSTYLEAKMWQAVLKQKYKIASALYSDEWTADDAFVVLAAKPVKGDEL